MHMQRAKAQTSLYSHTVLSECLQFAHKEKLADAKQRLYLDSKIKAWLESLLFADQGQLYTAQDFIRGVRFSNVLYAE